jgi:hypothetical protein
MCGSKRVARASAQSSAERQSDASALATIAPELPIENSTRQRLSAELPAWGMLVSCTLTRDTGLTMRWVAACVRRTANTRNWSPSGQRDSKYTSISVLHD